MLEWIPLILGGGNLLSSNIKGKDASKSANKQQAAMQKMAEEFIGMAQGQMDHLGGMADSFRSPFAGSGGSGGDFSVNMGHMGGGFQNQGTQNMFGVTGLGNQPHVGDDFAGNIMWRAMQAGDNMQGAILPLLDQARSGYESMIERGGMTPTYDFGGVRSFLDETMSKHAAYSDRTRASALENDAIAAQQTMGGLDAAMASRGISADSGVASGALSDLMRGQAQGRTDLERNLASMGEQASLGAAQMDTGNRLTLDNMASNFALGAADVGLRGMATGLGGLQGLAGAYESAYMNPLAFQQQLYQQNHLGPSMQYDMMNNPMALFELASSIMGGNLQNTGQNALLAGEGAGSAMSDLMQFFMSDLFSSLLGSTGGEE